MNIEHEYNNNGFCKFCGWERQFIEKTGRTCAGQAQDNAKIEIDSNPKQSHSKESLNTVPPVPSPPKKIPLSTQYMQNGRKFGGIFGFACVYFYVTSPSNPNKGNLLGIKQDVTIFSIVFGCMIIGTGIGYALGKWLDD
jgi:hypothetical protein